MAKKKKTERNRAGSTNLEAIANDLWSDPSEKNWNKFYSSVKKSKARYYKIVYETLKNSQDLMKSFALIYDSKMKQIAKIPIIKKNGGIEGATIYLKDLKNANVF
ncbi:MAG: hypothetical protein QW774_00750 [Candidatus Micrarchaeaceae archaeon]